MDGKEISPQHECQSGDQGPGEMDFQIFQKEIGEESAQKEVKDNDAVKGPIEWQEKK